MLNVHNNALPASFVRCAGLGRMIADLSKSVNLHKDSAFEILEYERAVIQAAREILKTLKAKEDDPDGV